MGIIEASLRLLRPHWTTRKDFFKFCEQFRKSCRFAKSFFSFLAHQRDAKFSWQASFAHHLQILQSKWQAEDKRIHKSSGNNKNQTRTDRCDGSWFVWTTETTPRPTADHQYSSIFPGQSRRLQTVQDKSIHWQRVKICQHKSNGKRQSCHTQMDGLHNVEQLQVHWELY